MKGVLMLVGLASVVYLGLWVMTNPNYYPLIDLPTVIESDADAFHIKLDIGVGIFLIVYGIIWGIIEGYKNLGLMWVASSDGTGQHLEWELSPIPIRCVDLAVRLLPSQREHGSPEYRC